MTSLGCTNAHQLNKLSKKSDDGYSWVQFSCPGSASQTVATTSSNAQGQMH